MKKILVTLVFLSFVTFGYAWQSPLTTYPVIFAHGMAGFDNIAGFNYWAGSGFDPVWDPCDAFLEVDCNQFISNGQDGKTYGAKVQPFHSSEVRGLDLANQIKTYLTGKGVYYCSIVGHSQGGLDLRKAAKVLKDWSAGPGAGVKKVRVAVSISSPHRGSPIAKYILDLGPGISSVISALAELYGNTINQAGNNAYAAAMQLTYENYVNYPNHKTYSTYYNGSRAFNNLYSCSDNAAYCRSWLTGQDSLLTINPLLWITYDGWMAIDADGSCTSISPYGDGTDFADCGNKGAQGQGDGTATDGDSDGLVGINSQQMGIRLVPHYDFWGDVDNGTADDTTLGSVDDLNRPTAAQQSSHVGVMDQDHMDVIGVGPDTLSEDAMYGAIFNRIAALD